MCPLRIILVFLSATIAGFFVLRNLKTPSGDYQGDDVDDTPVKARSDSSSSSTNSSKVCDVIGKGFWTFVDMASGKYLWRHLVSSSNLKRADDLNGKQLL